MLIEETSIENIPLWIENYTDKTIVVNGQLYTLPVLISEQDIIAIDVCLELISLQQILDLLSVADLHPEIIIFGTGKTRLCLDAKIEVGLFQQGIAVEIMPTASACRTVNILKAEDRNVWSFLWPN